ncbi:MAG: efflux RND transporter periplasmic adaptor subunit, partial [Flavobacteriales bacterium]
MKKYTIYLAILVAGLFLGWLLFGGAPNSETEHAHDTIITTNQKWTCSMHPQILKPEAGDCPICGMDLIPAERSATGLLADQFKLTKNAMALANIQTSIVGNSKAEDRAIKVSGRIVENEAANVVQVSYFSGRIEQLNVRFTGEEVRKGQLLATIYASELYEAQQEFITAISLKKSQPALYKAVRTKLKLWKLSENQINEIETSGIVKENVPIYATVSGTVLEKLVAQGEVVKQGQPLLKIANLNTVWGNFQVYESQLNRFKKGQEILVSTNAYPNKVFKSKVDFINPILDLATRTVKLRVVLNNEANIFKPGMFVEGKVKEISSNSSPRLTIPTSAVLWTGERSVVYLKATADAPIFQMKEIKLGNRVGDAYEILEGLSIGDEIVTNGTFTLDAAAQLKGKKSMMNMSGGKITTGHEGHLGMDNKTSAENENHLNKNERMKVLVEFQNQLKSVFNEYINLKDALVKDDSKSVVAESKKLLDKISKVEMKLLKSEETHKHWMSLEKEIKMATVSISETSDLKEQRNHFKNLSIYLTNAIEVFGINEKVYSQFCPMANNNKGAYWLSTEEKVVNPYFGNAMLT